MSAKKKTHKKTGAQEQRVVDPRPVVRI